MSERRIIVVLGMHRSGTSVCARALKVLGVDLGNDLLPPVEGDNEKGYWEDRNINALNIAMMDHLGMSWDSLNIVNANNLKDLRDAGFIQRAEELLQDKFRHTFIFAFKDPRTIRLIDFWEEVFLTANLTVNYIVAVRNPRSVVASLEKGRGVPRHIGYCLWLLHTLECLVKTDLRASVWVDYDEMIGQPGENLHKISKQFQLDIDYEELKDFAVGFIEQDLRHSSHEAENFSDDPESHPLTREVYGFCGELFRASNPQLSTQVREHLAKEYNRLRAYFPIIDQQWTMLKLTQNQCSNQECIIKVKDNILAEQAIRIEEYTTFVAKQSEELSRSFNAVETLQSITKKQMAELSKLSVKFSDSETLIGRQKDELDISFNTAKTLCNEVAKQSEQIKRLYAEKNDAINVIQELELDLRCLRDRFGFIESMLNSMCVGKNIIKVDGFDSKFYRMTNADLDDSGLDPLVHYLFHGQFEGRIAVPPIKEKRNYLVSFLKNIIK